MGGLVRVAGGALELPGGAVVRFMRTLRLPESGTHPLPPGLGAFPLRAAADGPDGVVDQGPDGGGVLLPVLQREAVWLGFAASAPVALQVRAGAVCAVSGRPWSGRLAQDPQNYLVLPRQPWLDGISSGRGTTRQFVATPPGPGPAAAAAGARLQLQVFELRAHARARAGAAQDRAGWGAARPGGRSGPVPGVPLAAPAPGEAVRVDAAATGLGAGGRMRQEVYPDPRPLDDWRDEPSARVWVHLVSAARWEQVTGRPAPDSPVDRAAYASAGLPWFAHYDEDAPDRPDPAA
ncbi:hypothetical protein [Actinacidiphila sp. bgisy145]|uniref:hypothetical protein n=1 Tax=Actinacidiphila sp. bgisy145 TaxID=3413792 RepID=UPI003EB732C7